METKLSMIQGLISDLIMTDYDRISMDGQNTINELCELLNIEIY